jgi:hypothetical protein
MLNSNDKRLVVLYIFSKKLLELLQIPKNFDKVRISQDILQTASYPPSTVGKRNRTANSW